MTSRINLIGCGQAAGSLARLWVQAGSVTIGGVINRSEVSTRKAVQKMGGGNAVKNLADMEPAEFWLIGASDDQIPGVVQAMAQSQQDFQGSLIFHLAGRFRFTTLSDRSPRPGWRPAPREPLSFFRCAAAR